MKSIQHEVYNYYKNQNTKIGRKVFNVLDREGIAGIVLNKDVFWFEFYSMRNSCPEVVYEHIKKHLQRQGYKYLYDIIPI